jgi:hypothetical protein
MVASQAIEPGNGWSYTDFLEYLSKNPHINGQDVAKLLVDSYIHGCEEYDTLDAATLSAVDLEKIDSLKNTLQATPQCLADLRQQLDSFVALYGVPVIVHPDEVCSDGTVRPTEEYLEYQKMKEEWEKNKPALDEECQKIYEEKLENIQKRINKCLNPFGTDQT